jgi:hypothetical protein
MSTNDALANVVAFKHKNSEEKAASAAHIYHVNENTL